MTSADWARDAAELGSSGSAAATAAGRSGHPKRTPPHAARSVRGRQRAVDEQVGEPPAQCVRRARHRDRRMEVQPVPT